MSDVYVFRQTDVGNMDWMYTRDKTNTDDYLLGKKIDKHFERGDKTPPKEGSFSHGNMRSKKPLYRMPS